MILKEKIRKIIAEAVLKIYGQEPRNIPVNYPEFKHFGDYATPIALSLARELKKNPREVAQALSSEFQGLPELEKVEIAGPGFINFFLSRAFISESLHAIAESTGYGRNSMLSGRSILLEYVSANPTGPLHIGHGRWAAIGDSMARVLRACGADLSTEFYINDGGNQINLLYQSVEAARNGQPVPENGYHGAYIADVAAMDGDPVKNLLEIQQKDLGEFRVSFDHYFSEKTLHESGAVLDTLEFLKKTGHTYELDGALWFRTTEFGDDKDRVLVKADGEKTYFAVDIAYHRNKIERMLKKENIELINVFGADHHGYVNRLRAAVRTFAHEAGRDVALNIIIGQLVSLYRDGVPVRMSKRTGDMVSLEEVREEIGVDAGRYYLVMRKADTPLEFDIEVAKKRSDDNPVFYVQYAHARICSILGKLDSEVKKGASDSQALIDCDEARDLAIKLIQFPEVVYETAQALEPHRVPVYLEELSKAFHFYYNHQRVITDDTEQTRRRVELINAVRKVLSRGLELIGVSAPESM